jgi:dUTP pyrophosphatase
MNKVQVKIINKSTNPLPMYSKEGDACVDLRVSFEESAPLLHNAHYNKEARQVVIQSMGKALIGTGIHIQFPDGYMFKILERSGLAVKGLIVSGGVIDSNYIGEIKIAVTNLSDRYIAINEGERIAQAALIPVPKIEWQEVSELENTVRGDNGFNSTGVK